MPIDVACPGCKKRYRVKDELAGKALRCKACQSVVHIPRPEPAPAPLDDLFDDAMVGLPDAGDPLAAPFAPSTSKPKRRKAKTEFRLPNLGIWWFGASFLPLMLLLWPLSFASRSAAGMLALVGCILPLMAIGIGLLGIVYGILRSAGSEGGNALFHVLFWTRTGRRFAYASWREYRTALFVFLQGIAIFLAGIGMVIAVGDRHRTPDSQTEVAQGVPAPTPEGTPIPYNEPDETESHIRHRPMDHMPTPRDSGPDEADSPFGDQPMDRTPAPHDSGPDEADSPFGHSTFPSSMPDHMKEEIQRAESAAEQSMQKFFEKSWQGRVERQAKKVGRDRVVTIVLQGVPFDVSPFRLKDHIEKNCRVQDVYVQPGQNDTWVLASPAEKLDAVATNLKLGTVTSVDRDLRRIYVKFNRGLLSERDRF